VRWHHCILVCTDVLRDSGRDRVTRFFAFRFFSWIIFPQASGNLQICGLTKLVTFADLPHVWQFAVFQISDPIFFAIFKFAICWPKFVADLKLLQICKFLIFLLTNTYLKCSNSNFYQIKNSAKQTSRQLLDSFVLKGGNFLERCLILSVLWWKICGFAICRSIKRNFVDSHISEICRFELRIFCAFLNKFETALMGYSGAWGELIHEKNLKLKISWHCPFKLPFACKKIVQSKNRSTMSFLVKW
jgi:hypothetical protein